MSVIGPHALPRENRNQTRNTLNEGKTTKIGSSGSGNSGFGVKSTFFGKESDNNEEIKNNFGLRGKSVFENPSRMNKAN
jgi:hypothetical protein